MTQYTQPHFQKSSRKALAAMLASTALTFAFYPTLSSALPTGGSVASGSATITSSGNKTTVNQTSQNSIINWLGFNTTKGQTVQFNDPNSSSITLNRVSGSATQYDGMLVSNGNVWLINPQGVAFNKDSSVNVNGLLATTSNISDANFNAGKYNFTPGGGAANASVSNAGTITVAQAGLATLASPNISNSGTINAKLGHVNLASGDTYTLDLNGDGLINLAASNAVTSQALSHSGTINASGGTVVLTAADASGVVDSLINLDGAITAENVTAVNHGGGVSVSNAAINATGGNITLSGIGTEDNAGVELNSATLTTDSGKIAITGNSAYGTAVYANNSNVTATGSGSIAVSGTTTAANGGAGVNTNNTGFSTSSGSLSITGSDQNASSNTNPETGFVDTNGYFSTVSGALSLKGTSVSSAYNAMVDDLVLNSSHILSNTGKINLTGTDSAGLASFGVQLNDATITSTGTGAGVGGIAVNATSGGLGIGLLGGSIQTADANISMTGAGQYGGIYTNNITGGYNPFISSTGAGSITVSGTALAGIDGYGVNTNNTGFSTSSGSLSITGSDQNASSNTNPETGFVDTNGYFSTVSGALSLKGTSVSSAYNAMVDDLVLNSSHILSNTGKINLTGTDSAGLASFGVQLNDATITSTGTGAGVGGIAVNATSGGLGIGLLGGSIQTADANISMTGAGQYGGIYTNNITGGYNPFISSTGAGSITVSGTALAGIDGYGVNTNNTGFSTSSGSLSITGSDQNASSNTNPETGFVDTNGYFSTVSGALSLKGTSVSSTYNAMVDDLVLNSSHILSNTGKINLTGTDSAGLASFGVQLNDATITSTGTGAGVGGIAVNATSGGLGIGLLGGSIQTADANISMTGAGQYGGIYTNNITGGYNPFISSTGAGSITVSGTALAGIDGYGVNTNNTGFSTSSGSLSITGSDQNASSNTNPETGFVDTNGYFSTVSGALSLKGTSVSSTYNAMVDDLVLNSSHILSNTGKINLTGTDSAGLASFGVQLNDATITSTGTGAGVGGIAVNATSGGLGIGIQNSTISSVDGNIVLTSPDGAYINDSDIYTTGKGKVIYHVNSIISE